VFGFRWSLKRRSVVKGLGATAVTAALAKPAWNMRKSFILSLVVAFVVALLVTAAADQRPFGEMAERAIIAEQANTPDSKCPLSRQYIDEADLGLLRICLKYGLGAYEAAQRYPESAAKVFAVYGDDETFQKILDQYGHPVIPVVAYFVENGSFKFKARQTLSEMLEQLRQGQKPKWEPAELTREQIGLLAIYEISTRGHEILAEFEIIDGIAKPKPVTGFILEAKQFLLGGVGDVEKVLVRGERRPTWKEAGLAGLDAIIIVGGVGAITKVARAGGDAAAEEESTGLLMAEGAYETVGVVGRTVVRIAPYAFLYVLVTRPTLILSLGGSVAEQFGINRYVGIFAVSFMGMLLAFQLLRPLIWCAQAVGRSFGLLRSLFAYRSRPRWRSQSLIRAG
jgi:hypothetical protein